MLGSSRTKADNLLVFHHWPLRIRLWALLRPNTFTVHCSCLHSQSRGFQSGFIGSPTLAFGQSQIVKILTRSHVIGHHPITFVALFSFYFFLMDKTTPISHEDQPRQCETEDQIKPPFLPQQLSGQQHVISLMVPHCRNCETLQSQLLATTK